MENNKNVILGDYRLGMMVRTTREFYQLPLGEIGTIVEDYGTGFMVQWKNHGFTDGFDKETELQYLEIVK